VDATQRGRLLVAEGATVGALLGGIVLWVLNEFVFKSSVPEWLEGLVDWAIPPVLALVGAFIGIRLTPDTPIGPGAKQQAAPPG
jgi:fructose-specific phosphotransferase system IIC component